MIVSSSKEFNRYGHRDRALVMLHQMIEDAHMGKRQFLSGNLSLVIFIVNIFSLLALPPFYM